MFKQCAKVLPLVKWQSPVWIGQFGSRVHALDFMCRGDTLGPWTGGVESFEEFVWGGSREMSHTVGQSRRFKRSCCCLEVNADSPSNRLLSYSITLSLDIFSSFFSLWIDIKLKEGWPPITSRQSSCAGQCVHMEKQFRHSRGRLTYGDLSNFKAKYGEHSFIRLPRWCF